AHVRGDLLDLGEIHAVLGEARIKDLDERVRVALARLPLSQSARQGGQCPDRATRGEKLSAVQGHASQYQGRRARCQARNGKRRGLSSLSGGADAAESEMASTGRNFAFAACPNHIARAVLITAQK